MVLFYPHVHVVGGDADLLTVYFSDGTNWHKIDSWSNFKVVKKINQMSDLEINLVGIEDTEKAYVKEKKEFLVFVGNTLFLKGRVQRVEYETAYDCKVLGNGIEVKLLEKEYENSTRNATEPKRIDYVDVSSKTIAKELLSVSSNAIAPWIIQPASTGLFATDYGNLSVQYEYTNRLNCLATLADSIDYEWWVSQSTDYATDYFNIATQKGSSTSVKTFEVSGANQNSTSTSKETDIENLVNKVELLGYGEGINQLRTYTYNASTTNSTLSLDITASGTTINVVSSTGFTNGMVIRIAKEQITIGTVSGNSFIGCTRPTDGTAKAHKKGCYVEKYVAHTSAEASSSIETNGLVDKTFIDKTIQEEPTLELVASRILLDRKDALVRITVSPDDPVDILEDVVVGDMVTVNDAESGITSTNYRIVGMTLNDEYGNTSVELELSNKSLEFIEQMTEIKEKNENISKYMQGSTNCYITGETDNCDATHGLRIDFYVPSEAINVNSIKVNYRLSKYRTWQGVTSGKGSGDVKANVIIEGSGFGTNCIVSDKVPYAYSALGTPAHSFKFGHFNNTINPITQRFLIGTTSGGSEIHDSGNVSIAGWGADDRLITIPNTNYQGVKIYFSLSTLTQADDLVWAEMITYDAHTHNVTYGISEDTGSWGVTDMTINVDGTDRTTAIETAKGSALSITEGGTENGSHMEIKDYLSTPVAGNWHYVIITPNNNCRITSDMFVQIFIESK